MCRDRPDFWDKTQPRRKICRTIVYLEYQTYPRNTRLGWRDSRLNFSSAITHDEVALKSTEETGENGTATLLPNHPQAVLPLHSQSHVLHSDTAMH
jgi:hypothetical protein